MGDVYEEIKEFTGGVQSAGPADRIPTNAMSRGVNTAFRNIGSGFANIGVRPCLKNVNSTAFSGTPAVHFQHLYSYNGGSSYTNYLAAVSADGTLRFKDGTDTYSAAMAPPANFPAPSGLCFTAGEQLVDATVMDNRLFLVNDESERRSLLGTTYHPWGLNTIASWSAASAATGINAMPNENYGVAVTTYDSSTGGESALSAETSVAMGGVNRRILVTIVPSAAESAQYSHWHVYLRRETTQAALYRVQTLYNAAGAVIVTDGNIPIGTLTAYVDLSAASIANHIITGIATGTGGPPPTGIRYLATYGRRLLCADQQQLYWSDLDKPDTFNPLNFEPIDTGEGDSITGISVFSDELLVIFTSSSVWGLFGNDPQTWVLRVIDHTVGCSSHLSVIDFDKKLGWWSQAEGPVVFDGTTINRVGLDNLGIDEIITNVESTRLAYIYGGHDPQGSRVVWSLPADGFTTRNTRMIPYNYRIKQFEASEWTPMDIASIATGYIADGTQRLFAGNYEGQVFYFDADTKVDGVRDTTTAQFTYTATATTTTTLTGTGFDTTGAGLAERYVVITDSNNRPIEKMRIASNTATVITLSTALENLSIGTTYTVYIGSPDLRLYTKWLDMDVTFVRKRFDRVYLHAESLGGLSTLLLSTQINFANDNLPTQDIALGGGATWDSGIWDSSVWIGATQLKKRLPLLRTGQSVRIGLFHFTPNADIIVHTIGLLARTQSDRYYD